MEHIAPLIQTMLWIGLIVWIILRFNTHLDAVLKSLQERIESGSRLKAGPIEIGELLKIQDADEQKELARQEIDSLAQQLPVPVTPNSRADLAQQYFLAEDLALRAIQDNYQTKLNRQLTDGSGGVFDAAFTLNGTLHVVEVKYVLKKHSIRNALRHVDQMTGSIARLGWKNVVIDLVLVSDTASATSIKRAEIEKMEKESKYPLRIWTYDLPSLRQQFGADRDED